MGETPAAHKLYAKIAEVVAEVGYVAKDGKNDFQNYKYTSAEAVLAAVRGPLSSRGVALMPSVTAISEREYTTSKGKASIITTAHVQFTFVDGESGEKHACEWAGQGDDPADKGLSKAYTNAAKTFLREVFLIPQGDDPEGDTATDARAADRVATHATRDAAELGEADIAVVLGAIKDAHMPMAWYRLQLIELGVKDLPETITQSVIRGLEPMIALKFVGVCEEAVRSREAVGSAK